MIRFIARLYLSMTPVVSTRTIRKLFLYPKDVVKISLHERRSLMIPISLACFISAADAGLSAVGLVGFLSLRPVFGVSFSASFGLVDLAAVAALLMIIVITLSGLLSSLVANATARAFGARSYFGEALRVEFYGILPYSIMVFPLTLSVFFPFPSLIIAVGFFFLAFVWQFYILVESFKEVYGLSSGKSVIVSLSPVVIPLLIFFFAEALTNIHV